MQRDFGEAAEKLRRGTVHIQVPRAGSTGSGIIAGADGVIVTNSHVARASTALVETWDGHRFEARLTARHPTQDLAALKIDASGLPALSFRDARQVRPGELVLAIGNPLGFLGALTTGVVCAVGPFPGLDARTWVQADVKLAPGNSGGPLADARGQVIGINTMVAAGLGLAVPSNHVRGLIEGADHRPRLGVSVRPVVMQRDGGDLPGWLILEVEPRGAAAAASLLPGDILVGAAEQPFRSLDDLGWAIESAGGTLRLRFLRGEGRVREVTVALTGELVEAA